MFDIPSNPFPWLEGRVVAVMHGQVEECEFYEEAKK